MKFCNNNSGFSLIEALAGVAIISMMALTVTKFGDVRKSSKGNKLGTSCNSIAKSVVEGVKDISVSSNFGGYFVGADGPLNAYSTNAITDFGGRATPGHAWVGAGGAPGETPFLLDLGAEAFEINTYMLRESSIRLLTSIYNSPGWTPATFNAYPPITNSAIVGDITKDTIAAPPTIRIKVIPYNIVTKLEVTPATPLFIRPKNNANFAPIAPPTITLSPLAVDNLGMRLAVEITYMNDGIPQTCQASHDFQYPRDMARPTISIFELIKNEYANGGASGNVVNQSPSHSYLCCSQ